MTTRLFGPATVTHDGTNIGKTSGGGSVEILKHETEVIDTFYRVDEKPYGIAGSLNLFQLDQSITITNSVNLYAYGQIVITLDYGTITLYKAKLNLPDTIPWGTFSLEPFTLKIIGGKDSSGNLIDFS